MMILLLYYGVVVAMKMPTDFKSERDRSKRRVLWQPMIQWLDGSAQRKKYCTK